LVASTLREVGVGIGGRIMIFSHVGKTIFIDFFYQYFRISTCGKKQKTRAFNVLEKTHALFSTTPTTAKK